MPQKYQKAILAQLGAGLHKSSPPAVKHTKLDAATNLPYDINGGGNQPYTGPVKNAAQGGLPSGNSAGSPSVPSAGNPNLPFTK